MEGKENKTNGINMVLVLIIVILLGIVGYCAYRLGDTGRSVIDDENLQKGGNTSVVVDATEETEVKEKNLNDLKIAVKEYKIGDEVVFNNEKWHVIHASSSSDDYVSLLKDNSISELDGKPYYECPPEDDNGINCNMKMSNDYNKSVPKKYFDNTYINLLGKEKLKEVDGYYVRLINLKELEELGCNDVLDSVGNRGCKTAPSWLHGEKESWTMSYASEALTDDATKADVWSFGYSCGSGCGQGVHKTGVGSTLSVRPVINLKKEYIK